MTALQFLERRFSALGDGDYAAVYDSYHHDAPFLQQFGSRGSYLRFAEQQLSGIEIETWYCLSQRRVDETRQEALLVMELGTEVGSELFYELAMLIKTDVGWRYHSAQKLGTDDYPGSPDKIDFHHFDCAAQKIRF